MEFFLQAIGLAGGVLVLTAYFPQIAKLLRVRKSTGMSLTTWAIWLLGALLFFVYAVSTGDPVFITIDFLELTAILIVLLLAWRYRDQKRSTLRKEKVSSRTFRR